MPPCDPVIAITPDVVQWRHTNHANPELGFQGYETARFVAERLRSFGLEVHEGIGGTGVVGIMRNGTGAGTIGLRAELDALPVQERTGLPYASRREGVMHACGHSAMLLGAAKFLSHSPAFDSTVALIFQLAEENNGGGMRMIEDGLLEHFPLQAVYAIQNWPALPVESIAMRIGSQMAAVDGFEVSFKGTGAHAAMQHLGDDPVLAAGAFIEAVQRVVSLSVDPLVPLVVSLTQIHDGNVGNIVPAKVWLQGTCRFFEPFLAEHCEWVIGEIVRGVAATHGGRDRLEYKRGYLSVVNTAEETTQALVAATEAVGVAQVMSEFQPSLGCENFAYMSRAVDGTYAWIGVGDVGPGDGLHGVRYVFNDAIVPVGLRYWTRLVSQVMPTARAKTV